MATNLTAIVLAAGTKELHDIPKLALPVDGKPILQRVVERVVASKVRETLVVIGHEKERMAAIVQGTGARTVDNPRFATGEISSVRAGVDAAPVDADGVMIVPGDMPLLETELLNRLIDRFAEANEGILVPAYQGTPGYPMLFDRRHREALLALKDTDVLYSMLANNPRDVLDIHLVTDSIQFDVDDEDDYAALHGRLGLTNPKAAAPAGVSGSAL